MIAQLAKRSLGHVKVELKKNPIYLKKPMQWSRSFGYD
jgi:hypothetical protein